MQMALLKEGLVICTDCIIFGLSFLKAKIINFYIEMLFRKNSI